LNSILDFETLISDFHELLNGSCLKTGPNFISDLIGESPIYWAASQSHEDARHEIFRTLSRGKTETRRWEQSV